MPANTPPSPRHDLNGLRVKRPEHPAIYLVDLGFKRLIPNPKTFNSIFRDWNDIVVDLVLDEIPDGPFLSDGAVLVRPPDSESVFLIDRGAKRAITSPEAMDRYHFDSKKIVVVPQIIIDALPTGKPLSV